MKQYRTAEQVKKFDIFKVVTFGILVILLLLAYGAFRDVEAPPALTVAEATSETETTTAQSGSTPASGSIVAVPPTSEPEVITPATESTSENVSSSGAAATSVSEVAAAQPASTTESNTVPVAEATSELEVTTPATVATTENAPTATTEATTEAEITTPAPTVESSSTPGAEATSESEADSGTEVKLTAPTLDLPSGELTAGPVTLTGIGEPGSEVEIVIDGQVAGQATVGSAGTWSFVADLPDPGEYQVRVQNVDAAGKILASSEAVALTLVAPAAVVTAPTLDLPTEKLTAGPVVLTGSGEPGSQIQVVVDGQAVGTATVDKDGQWSLSVELPKWGSYQIGLESLDETGTVVAASAEVELEVTEAVVVAPTLDLSGGEVPAGEVTLTGTGEPGSKVEVLVAGKSAGAATVTADGTWELVVLLPKAGEYEIEAQRVDTAGRVVAAAKPVTLLVTEVTRPAAEASSEQTDGQAYIVQLDDWLSKLALKFYNDMTKYPAIVEATNAKAQEDSTFTVITNPDLIEIGQKLWIPAVVP